MCLKLLYRHHVFNGVDNIERLNIEAEFARFDLCIIQQVLHQKVHKTSRSLLHMQSFIKFIQILEDGQLNI